MKIDRTLFWFRDGNETLLILNENFFALGILLNRLLNENYSGKKIKFINIDFSTLKTYELHSKLPKNDVYFYTGHLRYYGTFDVIKFNALSEYEQKLFIWERAFEYLQASAKAISSKSLSDAIEYAYNKGLEINLNPDYRMIESNVVIFGKPVKASIWINFRADGMHSKLTLEIDERIIFEKDIDKAKNGIEFFLVMYKSIEAKDNSIIVKGLKDVSYLPLKIPIDPNFIKV